MLDASFFMHLDTQLRMFHEVKALFLFKWKQEAHTRVNNGYNFGFGKLKLKLFHFFLPQTKKIGKLMLENSYKILRSEI